MPRIWREVRHVLGLAVPVALAELGWIAMNVVDTIMVGHLGPAAIGAIAVGGSAFYAFAIFGMGLLLGLDTLVSHAYGRGDREDSHHSLAQAIYLAAMLTPPLMLLFFAMPVFFRLSGIEPEVSALGASFVRVLSFSTLPLLLYGAFRRYLQASGHVRPVMFVLISANLVNWLCNWLLIEGHWGFPRLGVAGSALSTVFARVYMAASLGAMVWWFERKLSPGPADIIRRFDRTRVVRLLRIGLPAATQIFFEIAAFGAAAFLAGRLTSVALAAHQISINVASVSYMIPLGISSAAAVTVGHSIGRGHLQRARSHGFIALAIACVYAVLAAGVFLLAPYPLLRIYTNNAEILDIGSKLLLFAAAFQLFDGIQTVATGALRGLGNTRIAMLVNLAGYYLFGLPIGYFLCFRFDQGIYGLWLGLTLALLAISLVLFYEWHNKSRQLHVSVR